MPYRTTKPINALSVGLVRGAGRSIGRSELPPTLFDALLAEGVIVEVSPPQAKAEEDLGKLTNNQLRERLAVAGLSTNGNKAELMARLQGGENG